MKKKRNTKLTARDVIIVLLCLAGIATTVFLYYKDVNATLEANSDPIGVIYFKQNTAQRRLQGRNLWERLRVTSPIYEGDRIRTGELSEAAALFNDGSKIDIHENTLIQIFDNKDKVLHFINGSISVVSGEESKGISVQTGDKLINFGENTSAVISIPKKSEVYENSESKLVQEASIAVTSGEARVTSINKSATPINRIKQKVVKTVTGEDISRKIEQIISAGNAEIIETAYIPVQEEEVKSPAVVEEEIRIIAKENTEKRSKEKFTVIMPAESYSITQSSSSNAESVPFFWNMYDQVKIETSFNPSFNEIIETYVFSTELHKGSLKFTFARPDDIIYWRAIPVVNEENQEFENKSQFPVGKILVKAPLNTKEDLKIALNIPEATIVHQKYEKIQDNVAQNVEKVVKELPVAKTVEKTVEVVEEIEEDKSFAEKMAAMEAERLAEIKRKEDELKRAEALRRAEEKRIAEAAKAEEARRIAAEKKRLEELKKKEEAARKAEEIRKARLEAERKEKLRLEAERKEAERLQKELEAARLKKELEERERLEAERIAKEQELLAAIKAEEERLLAEKLKAEEELRKQEEEKLRIQEELRRQEELRKAEEEKRLAEERRIAEEKRIKKEQIEAELRRAEEARKAEEARITEELRRVEEERKAKEARRKEILRKAEEARKAEEERLAQEVQKQEEERIAEEKRKLEEGYLIEAARKAEEERKANEKQAEKARLLEATRIANELKKAEEEKILREIKRLEEEKKAQEERLLAEAKKVEEARINAEKKKAVAEAVLKAEAAEKEIEEKTEESGKKSEIALKTEEAKKKAALALEEEEKQKAEIAEEKEEVLPPITKVEPILLSPRNNYTFMDDDFVNVENPKVIFSWKPVESAMAYRFVLKTAEGKTLLIKTLSSPKYILSDRIKFISESGVYEWSVTALTKVDNKTYTSLTGSRKFTVSLSEVKAASLDSSNLITSK